MSQDRNRLLEHLVYDQFGSAVGEVASLLLQRGTLPFAQLLRLTSLPPAILHKSLLILSLHQCLYHSETETNNHLTELYEINSTGIEHRMRGAIYAEMVEKDFSEGGFEGAREVVEGFWREGMGRVEEVVEKVSGKILVEREVRGVLREAREGAKEKEREPKVGEKRKGKSKAQLTDGGIDGARAAAYETIKRLHQLGYISIVTPGSQTSPDSLQIKWELELRESIRGVPTTKQLKEMNDDLRNKTIQTDVAERALARGGQPDMTNGTTKKKKRSKRADSDEPLPSEYEFNEDAWYKLNPERFHIRWRSQLIRDYAEKRYNAAAGAVMQVVLGIAERDIGMLKTPDSRAISINEIVQGVLALKPAPDLRSAFEQKPGDVFKPHKATDAALTVELLKILSRDDDYSFDRSNAFLTQLGGGDGAGAKYKVQYSEIGARMKRALVEAMIEEKLSSDAAKCWRILEQKGKLDEKILAKMAFLSVKDTREIISSLSSATLIEPQEVPRSADRAPSRTFFLWFVDYAKTITTLTSHLYKSLANLQAQKQFQLGLKASLVAKRERSDVRADESLLGEVDKASLEAMDRILEALTVAELRIDAGLFVLQL